MDLYTAAAARVVCVCVGGGGGCLYGRVMRPKLTKRRVLLVYFVRRRMRIM